VNGDTAVIGARLNDGGNGSAYVFTRSGTTWTQQAKITASDGGYGFGKSVSVYGNTAVIGANSYLYKGSAYVFTRSGTTWTQQAKITASDGESYDLFGESVSLNGDTAVIGAYWDDGRKGSAYVFSLLPTYTISVSTSPAGLTTPSGGGTYTSGQTATVVAQTVSGYTFDKWTENGNKVSTSASYSFTVTGNRNLVAVYQLNNVACDRKKHDDNDKKLDDDRKKIDDDKKKLDDDIKKKADGKTIDADKKKYDDDRRKYDDHKKQRDDDEKKCSHDRKKD
jgi:hypothetical protein